MKSFARLFGLYALFSVLLRLVDIQGVREDMWKWHVFIEGVDCGVWDAKDGGEVDSDQNQYKPGAMANPYSLGGSRTVGNLTLRRNYRLARDHQMSQRMIEWAGSADVKAIGTVLDKDGNAFGTPYTYNGTLKRFTPPTHDSTSTAPGMVEIEIVVDGFPTAMKR